MGTDAQQQLQGGSAWAAEQIAAGRPVRSVGWFRGSIHPYQDQGGAGRIFYRSEDPTVPVDQQDVDHGLASTFFAKNRDDLWEHADVPRRSFAGSSTAIDLAFFPSAMPAVTVMQILDRCESEKDDFAQIVELVWVHAGQSMIGKALAAALNDPVLRVSIQLARNGNPIARKAVREAIAKLREGR